jgi:hypothetical protein
MVNWRRLDTSESFAFNSVPIASETNDPTPQATGHELVDEPFDEGGATLIAAAKIGLNGTARKAAAAKTVIILRIQSP